MRPLSNRERSILFLCILTVLIFIGYNGVVQPLRRKTETLKERVNSSEQKLKKQFSVLEKSKSGNKEYEQYLAIFRQSASDGQIMSSILSEIESVARENGMRIADMKPKKVKHIDFYNNFSVTLAMSGQLTDIVKFLYILQNQPHFFNIEELVIEKNSPRAPTLDCRLVLDRILIP